LVVIVICDFFNKEIFRYKDQDGEEVIKYTYDFLMNILPSLRDKIQNLEGSCRTSPYSNLKDYFENVDHYHVIFNLTQNDLFENETLRSISRVDGIRKTPIAAKIEIGKGKLVLLPGFSTVKEKEMFQILFDLCKTYYQEQQNKLSESRISEDRENIPDWIENYKIERHKEIPSEIKKLKEEYEKYEKIQYLLYGTGKQLEQSVKLVFEELGMKVDEKKPGDPVDLIATCETIKLVIEVTGSEHRIKGDTRKIRQTVQYQLQGKEEEKIIVIANTYKNLDLVDRKGMENFTEQVRKVLEGTGVAMITTMDLYFLWKAVFEGKLTKREVIKQIHSCKGVFSLENQYLPAKLRKGG